MKSTGGFSCRPHDIKARPLISAWKTSFLLFHNLFFSVIVLPRIGCDVLMLHISDEAVLTTGLI